VLKREVHTDIALQERVKKKGHTARCDIYHRYSCTYETSVTYRKNLNVGFGLESNSLCDCDLYLCSHSFCPSILEG
jgi:hypothetical protein